MKAISGTDWGACAKTLRTTYISFIRPVLDYASPVFAGASLSNLEKLDRVQHNASRIITGTVRSCPTSISQYEADCCHWDCEDRNLLLNVLAHALCTFSTLPVSAIGSLNPHTGWKINRLQCISCELLQTKSSLVPFSQSSSSIQRRLAYQKIRVWSSDELQQHDKRDNPHLMHALNLT